MSKPPPDYDAIEKKLWKKNAGEVNARLDDNDPDLLQRIKTFIWRFGFGEHKVREKIQADKMFASHFAKEPRRQGFHEKVAAQWIKELDAVDNFQVLPKYGKNAYYITSDGEIRSDMDSRPSKSLDFRWDTGRTKFFAAHKYTKEGGGNQDSQFLEMKNLLLKFMVGAAEGCVLLVIVDGPYYTETRMAELRHFARTNAPKSFAGAIQDVPSILSQYAI